jgi:DNA-binding MarR family transcriptional regulator
MVRLLDAAAASGRDARPGRRRRVVSLTPDGEAGLRAAMEVARAVEDEPLVPFERRALHALLERLGS